MQAQALQWGGIVLAILSKNVSLTCCSCILRERHLDFESIAEFSAIEIHNGSGGLSLEMETQQSLCCWGCISYPE